jgi:hydroxypyruvate isomerase
MRPIAASVTLLFREVPLLDRFAAARRAGFRGVEIQRLHEGVPSEMARAARDAGVEVLLVNCGMADYVEGGLGLSGVPGREAAFRDAVAEAVEAAALLGARFLHLGPSRIPDGVSRADCLATYGQNVRVAQVISRALGITLLIEAMNPVDAPSALFTDVAQVHALLQTLDAQRLGLLFDVYHVVMAGADPVATFRAVQRAVCHVQFADAPGRHEPGTGTTPVLQILTRLQASGYRGWFGAEYWPATTTEASLAWYADVLAQDASHASRSTMTAGHPPPGSPVHCEVPR